MNQDKNKPNAQTPRGSAASRSGGYKIVGFPKEFEKNIWEDLDKRFYLILFCSWLFVYTIAIIMGNTEYDTAA